MILQEAHVHLTDIVSKHFDCIFFFHIFSHLQSTVAYLHPSRILQVGYSHTHKPDTRNDISAIMADTNPETAVTIEYRGRVAIITFNLEKKLNAMTQDCYFRLSQLMREVANRDDVFVTVLTGKGRFFSA